MCVRARVCVCRERDNKYDLSRSVQHVTAQKQMAEEEEGEEERGGDREKQKNRSGGHIVVVVIKVVACNQS